MEVEEIENNNISELRERVKEAEAIIVKNTYFPVPQNKQSNELTQTIGVKSRVVNNRVYGKITIEVSDINLYLKTAPVTAKMLLGCLYRSYHDNNFTGVLENDLEVIVQTSLRDYMELRGLSDRATTYDSVMSDLKYLNNIAVVSSQGGSTAVIHIFSGKYGIKKGKPSVIWAGMHKVWLDGLKTFAYMPVKAFQVRANHNPYSYDLCYAMALHKRRNLGKANENVVGVKTLIKGCPSLANNIEDKRFDTRVLEAFERDLNYFEGSLNWEYRGKRGQQVDTPRTLEEFQNTNIKSEFKEYPELIGFRKRLKTQKAKRSGKKTS